MPFKLLGIFLLLLLFVFMCGCLASDISPPTLRYQITITGLDNFIDGNGTTIMIPVPMMNREPLFTDRQIMPEMPNSTVWSPHIVMTEHGKMIAFRTNNSSLTNIKFNSGTTINEWANKSMSERRAEANRLMKNPLYPIINDREAKYTQWINDGSVRNYTSYVYIDKNIRTEDNQNRTITFDLELTVFEGQSGSTYGSRYYTNIKEDIPAGVTGWIPVTVQIK